jgi:CubicO group peptidase (beta-lactamase class C family)
VRKAFIESFTRRGELGGACCVYEDGEPVVDLWGGAKSWAGEPWQPDTMVVIHSASKGLAAMVMALAHSRGWLDYDRTVASYWPEFAQNGKEHVTVRQLLAHQAGLFAFDEPVDGAVVADLDRLATILARQRPAWEPGEVQAYHAITLGFYEGELVRRIDPRHRTLGQVFQEDIADRLGLDAYLRVPASIPNERMARLEPPSLWRRVTGMPIGLTLQAMDRHSVLYRSLVANPGTGFYLGEDGYIVRDLEAPSGAGVASARGLARAYGEFASGGHLLGLRSETLAALAAAPIPARRGFYDACFRGPAAFSLGFMKPNDGFPFGHPSSFGAPGAGGAMGYADPETGIGYGYVTSRMGMHLSGDPRDVALRAALPDDRRPRGTGDLPSAWSARATA